MATEPHTSPDHRPAHWRGTLRRTLVLLLVWGIVGPVLGILFVDVLDRVSVGGMPLGFWVAQQGAIYVFVVLIFLSAWLGDRADRRAGVRERVETDSIPGH